MKLLSCLFLASIIAASPAHHSGRNGHIRSPLTRGSAGPVDLSVLKAQLLHLPNKYRQTFAAFEANTGAAHPLSRKMMSSTTKRDSSTIPLFNQGILQWYGEIEVGTPKQAFNVSIDTGSTDLFLSSVGCVPCEGHKMYDATHSSTSEYQGVSVIIGYGEGDVEGGEYSDDVFFGGYEAQNQSFVAASSYSIGFSIWESTPDGLVGLAFQQLSVSGKPSVFQTISESGLLTSNQFGIKLSATAAESELCIGGTNTDLYVEDTLTYTAVTEQGYWQVNLEAVSRNGSAVATNTTSIVDTGTTYIVAPDDAAAAYFSGIPGYTSSTLGDLTYYTIPCDTIGMYTPTFAFGGREFNVSEATFNLGSDSGDLSDCHVGFAGMSNTDFWTIGDVFLQNVYTVFDLSLPSVGFAELK